MLMNNLIKIVLSETEKRVLFIVFFVFIIVLFVVGILTHLSEKISNKQGKKIDKLITGYVKYGFVDNEKDFKKVAKDKNRIYLLRQMFIPMLILITSFILFSIYLSVTKQKFSYIFPIYSDMLIRFDVETTTVFGFLKVWTSWPKISEDSLIFYNSSEAIIAYIFLILIILGTILLSSAVFKYIAREKRIKEKAKTIFEVSIDNETPIEP